MTKLTLETVAEWESELERGNTSRYARLLAFARSRLTAEAAALIDRPPWNYDDVSTENLRACLASILASVEQGDAERARSLDTIAQMRAELDRRALPVLRVTERQLRQFQPRAGGECEPTSAAEPSREAL